MKKIMITLIGVVFFFTLFGCSKEPEEPFFNLIYNGYTNMTRILEYQDKDIIRVTKGEVGTDYLKLKQGSKLEYKSSESIDKCTLLIQNMESKEKVKEVILDTYKVDTDISQGKYIYTFFAEWKDGSAKFIKFIQIE